MSELVNIQSDYEYVVGMLQGNIMNLEAMFTNGEWTRQELEQIRVELEEAGHTFARAQGLGGTNLDNNIIALITDNNTINFANYAFDARGRYYAGHVEYGHRTRNGQGFVDARPFMRPAMYAVADATRGRLGGTVSRYIEQAWRLEPIRFAHMNTSGRQRAFYASKPGQYVNRNQDKRNRLPNQKPERIQSKNYEQNVYRGSNQGYSADIKRVHGWI